MLRVFRERELRILLLAAVAAALGILSLCGLLYVRTWQNQQVRQQVSENCQSVEVLKTTIRATFMDARARVEQSDLPPTQKAAALGYYDRELARYAAAECPGP